MEWQEIHLGRDGARQPDLPTNEKEKSELRGLQGSMSWICGQTNFTHAVDVNFLITTVPVSTAAEILIDGQQVGSEHPKMATSQAEDPQL